MNMMPLLLVLPALHITPKVGKILKVNRKIWNLRSILLQRIEIKLYMIFFKHDDDEELENPDDEEASLAEDLLDEVGEDVAEVEDDMEGFGLLTEEEEKEDKEEKEDDDEEEEASLDEDAEDVDFDTFDDIDEM